MENNKKVGFGLVLQLADEIESDAAIADVILNLSMEDAPMSDAVIALGVALDVLEEGYHNGWSAEEQQ